MTGESGVCTFNWSCVNVAHGVHIGSCVDRFFVGSCCKIPGNSSYLPRQSSASSYGGTEATKETPEVESTSETAVTTQKLPITQQEVTFIDSSKQNLSDIKDSEAGVHSATESVSIPDYTTVPYSLLINYIQSSSVPSSSYSRKPVLPHAFHTTNSYKSNNFIHSTYAPDPGELSTVAASHSREKFPGTTNIATIVQRKDSALGEPILTKPNSSKFDKKNEENKLTHNVDSFKEGFKHYNGTVSGEDKHNQQLSFVLDDSNKKSPYSSHHDQTASNTFLSWAYNFITNRNISSVNLVQPADQNSSLLLSSTSANTLFSETKSANSHYDNKTAVVDTNINEILTSSDSSTDNGNSDNISAVSFNFTEFTEIAYPWPSPKPLITKDAEFNSTSSTGEIMQNIARVCGRPRNHVKPRIVGGRKSHYLRWPWMISLRRYEGKSYKHKCGAALLNQLWAITAAHCVDGKFPNDVILRLGEYNFHRSDEFHPHIERRIYIMVIHPEFDPATYENDLALLRFYEPVRFQANIVPVCLPKFSEDLAGRTAVVTGWGRLAEEGDLPGSLHEVRMPIMTNKECEEMYSQAGYSETIRDVFMCAGLMNGGLDACEGDSGGPMVVKGDRGQWILVGLISWGMGCAVPRQPGVYTRITKFVDWIDEIIT